MRKGLEAAVRKPGEYGPLAACYDAMTTDVGYPQWADFLEKLFRRSGFPVHSVLDLACGTGTMACLLADRGYEVIGVDFSPDMLAQAMEKALDVSEERPIFLCQPMEKLDLYGTVDACVCLLDSVNHMTSPKRLQQAIQRVHLFLEPGGLFVFDIHTPAHLESLDGQVFLDETEGDFCVWRTEYAPRRRICTYDMDIFRREEGGLWSRGQETHEEFAYTPQELEDMLAAAGFVEIRQYGGLKLRPPVPGEDRIFFTARKKGN